VLNLHGESIDDLRIDEQAPAFCRATRHEIPVGSEVGERSQTWGTAMGHAGR
jgi:hypothetical protein